MGEVHVHLKLSVLVLGVEVGTHEEVADVLRPGRPQKPVAVEPREAPHVLVLQAAAVAEAVNLRGHDVVPHLQVLGHLEDSQGARALAVAHLLAIDPEKERRVGPFELEKHAAVVPAVGNGKGAAVGPDGITRVMGRERVGRRSHHARRVHLERISGVQVDRRTVALHLPVAEHRNAVPVTYVVAWLVKIGGPTLRIGRPMETPVAVERADGAAVEPSAVEGGVAGRVGHPGGRRGLRAATQHVEVLEFGGDGGGVGARTGLFILGCGGH
jgi:hypothetical protein